MQMNNESYVIMRGYDLFFRQASEQTLSDICSELGDKSTYDFKAQKVTCMLTNDVLIELTKLEDCHDVTNTAGQYFDRKYDCDFVASELYLQMTEKQTRSFKHKHISLISNI